MSQIHRTLRNVLLSSARKNENCAYEKNGEIQLTDALQIQANRGCVMAYKFKGRRFDCGSVPGFVEATNFIYEHYYKEMT